MDHASQTDTANPTDPTTHRRAMLAGIGGLAAGALLAGKANAGPLTPPPGAIAPTPGPEPRIPINAQNTPGTLGSQFRISARGSYYLTGDIVTARQVGLLIDTNDVTVDLMGYTIISSTISSSQIGIRIAGTRRNIVIRNGIVRGFFSGIAWELAMSSNGLVERIAVSDNTGIGIGAPVNAIIRGCALIGNGSFGIVTASNASVSDCTVADGSGTGISVSAGSVVTNSTSRNNSGRGIVISADCMVSGCVSSSNGQQGIHATSPRCLIRDNQVSENRLRGIEAVSDSTISHNNIVNNRNASNQGAGIRVSGAGNRIEGNNIVLQAPGIEATGGGNIIIRNTLRANNPTFSLAGGNTTGPTVTSTNIASSNNPHANYTF